MSFNSTTARVLTIVFILMSIQSDRRAFGADPANVNPPPYSSTCGGASSSLTIGGAGGTGFVAGGGYATIVASDLTYPSASGSWTLSRTYSSYEGVLDGTTRMSPGWSSNQADMVLHGFAFGSIPGHPDWPERYELSGSSLEKTTLVYDFSLGNYVVDRDSPFVIVPSGKTAIVRRKGSSERWEFETNHQNEYHNWTLRKYSNGGGEFVYHVYDHADGVSEILDDKAYLVTTPDGGSIAFTYDEYTGALTEVTALSPTGMMVGKTIYTYEEPPEEDDEGDFVARRYDLLQVENLRLASDGVTLVSELTQYRYVGDTHVISHVLDDAAIRRAMQEFGVTDPKDLFSIENDDTGASGVRFDEFITQSVDFGGSGDTSNVSTGFSGTSSENLNSRYGGANANLSDVFIGANGGQGGGCSGCGSSSSGSGSKRYFYMNINGGPTVDQSKPWNTVVRIVVEDTLDDEGNPVYRRVWGINDANRMLREATILNPLDDSGSGATTRYICKSVTYRTDTGLTDRISETRGPSAHDDSVISAASFRKFLDPSTSTNDPDTLDASGEIRLNDYNTALHRIATLVKNGSGGTAYYLTYESFNDTLNGGDGDERPAASWTFDSPVAYSSSLNPDSAGGIKTTYSYSFWDTQKTLLKQLTVTEPVVSTTENGSGIASSTSEYFDSEGRLRWQKDGEGHINYFSYHPENGGQTYRAVDVNSSNSSHFSSTSTRLAWSGSPPAGFATTVSNPVDLAYQSTVDINGRVTSTTSASGKVEVTKYFADGTAQFSYVSGTTAALPVSITKTNAAGQVTDQYAVKPSAMATTATSLPATQSDFVSWTRYFYDSVSGELVKELTYHSIPDSGPGSHLTHYQVTAHQYDAMGRESVTIQTVQSDSGYQDQISRVTYDNLGRQIKSERGVGNSGVITVADGTLGTLSLSGLATVSETSYDTAGRVVSSKSFYGTSSTSYIESIPKYNYRGQVRGSAQNNGGTGFGPYQVRDLDWLGRTVASATYTSEPNWTTVLSTDNFVSTTSTNRNNLSKQYYDDLGRVYRTERFPGTEGTNHFASNTFYDRNGRMVASQQVNGMAQEVAYDGAGRQYQSRTVQALSSTKYSSGAYIYVAPTPNPSLTSMSGGNGGVIAMSHSTFSADGNVLGQHSFEVNNGDTDGLSISSGQPSDGVRTTVYNWYDSADRLVTTADYGCGVGNVINTWRASALPAYTEPAENNGNVLLTKFTYNADTGRQETVKSWQTATASSTSKTFYDDLGRRTFQVDNHSDFEGSPNTGIGGGTNNEQDVVVGWQYNGLGQVTKLTAYNATTESGSMLIVPQETEYQYRDPHNASLVTLEKYPDGTLTGSDNIQKTYHLDGSLNTRTDQRGVTLTYSFDTARRVTLEAATNLTSDVDNHVQALGRTYDSLGRVTKVTSYAGTTTGSTVRNEVETVYNTLGQVVQSYQAHSGATSGSSPSVQYAYDTSAVSNVYDDALRPTSTTYPNGSRQILYSYGTSGSRSDLLSRMEKIQEGSIDLTQYAYNGTGRLVNTKLLPPGVESLTGASSSTFSYLDQWGRVRQTRWFKSSTSSHVDSVLYSYDRAGNRVLRDVQMNLINNSFTDERDQTYEYDLLNRLKSADQKAGSTVKLKQAWGLDQLGNWSAYQQDGKNDYSSVYNNSYADTADLNQTRKHNAVNEIDNDNDHANSPSSTITNGGGQSAWALPAYDGSGNMTSMPKPKALGSDYTVKYDAWNRLSTVADGGTVIQTNRYDGLHRRVSRESNTTGVRHFYWNESWQCVEERVDASTTADRQYVWHPCYIDALAISTNSSGTAHYYVQDGNFNVTAAMDSSGAVVERYSYTPYGESIVLNADFTLDSSSGGDGLSDISNEYTYTGRRLDVETGLYQYRHRYYHAGLGRFVNRDPIGYVDGMNRYWYTGGGPLSSIDPTGEIALCSSLNATVNVAIGPGAIGQSGWGCGLVTDARIRKEVGNAIAAQGFPMTTFHSKGCPIGQKCCSIGSVAASASISFSVAVELELPGPNCNVTVPITITGVAIASFGYCAPSCCGAPPPYTLPPIIVPLGTITLPPIEVL